MTEQPAGEQPPVEEVRPERSEPAAQERPLNPQERHQTPAREPDEAGSAAVVRVARAQIFMSAFVKCAHDRYPDAWAPHARVAKLIEDRPAWYKCAWWADFLCLILAVLVVVAAAGSAIYKTFWT